MTRPLVNLDGATLHLQDVYNVAHGHSSLGVIDAVYQRMDEARAHVDEIAQGSAPVYGINTGFGALAETQVAPADIERLQFNLIVSHAVGVSDPLGSVAARALMLLRANTLAVGHSGCRRTLLERLVTLLNKNVAPYVPSRGSVGASGDLAPLAHVAMLLLGEGKAFIGDRQTSAMEALTHAGLDPLVLKAKEGLALINGTQAMAAVGILALLEAERLCAYADLIGALSLDALQGTVRAFDERIHRARPHPGQLKVAKNLRTYLSESELMESHKDCGKVQDPYSLRCMPQVHGATRDGLAYIRQVLEREINSATDNPLVFMDDFGVPGTDVISGGNFHGQPLALALDFLAICIAEIANISERRIEQLVNPALNSGLPAFLAKDPGLNSGYMILQVTAASLINENKVYCHPASVDSIPSSANREDHVSMGMTSANKATSVVENVQRVLGIELICACQAIDFRTGAPGKRLVSLHKRVRKDITFAEQDRAYGDDLSAIFLLMKSGELMQLSDDDFQPSP